MARTLGSLCPGGRSSLRIPSTTWRTNCSRIDNSLFLVIQKRMGPLGYHDRKREHPGAEASGAPGECSHGFRHRGRWKTAMHNREHIVIFRPGPTGLLMHTMYYTHEIRKVEEFRTDTSVVSDK